MMNYMRSETYKLLKAKGIYITYALCITLLILAALTLYYFGHNGEYFRTIEQTSTITMCLECGFSL